MNNTRKYLSLGGVLVATASAVSGGVLAFSPAFASTGSTTSTAASATPECRNGDLTATYKDRDAGMSHRFGTLVLENTSDATCFVQGYGGLSYVGGGSGKQVGAAATRTPGKAPKVTLEPGDKARSAVSETSTGPYSAKECQPTKVDGFRVYVPDSTKAQFVAHKTTTCANTDLDMLTHKAFH
jgi:hypothetical protein